MLSLVLLVIIVANVIIWSYQMNQFDWERIHEDVQIVNVEHLNASAWSIAKGEFTVNMGTRISGTYSDTENVDSQYESFTEGLNSGNSDYAPMLSIDNAFTIDLMAYPLDHIKTIEIQMRYRANDSGDTWFLKAYNWATSNYDDNNLNFSLGQIPSTSWQYYAVNLTDQWRSYVHDNGTMRVELVNEPADMNQTTFDIDFLGVRAVIDGTQVTLDNNGSTTVHLVSLWADNETIHQRYDMSLFINSGERATYARADITLPIGPFVVRIVTEKGTVSVFRVS